MSRVKETEETVKKAEKCFDPQTAMCFLLQEIALSIAVIADKLTEQHESEVME